MYIRRVMAASCASKVLKHPIYIVSYAYKQSDASWEPTTRDSSTESSMTHSYIHSGKDEKADVGKGCSRRKIVEHFDNEALRGDCGGRSWWW